MGGTPETRNPAHHAAALHRSSIVIDTHADTPQRFLDEGWDFTAPLDSGRYSGHINLASARAGNLSAEFFAIWVDPGQFAPQQYLERTLALIDAVHRQVAAHPAELALCRNPHELLAARAAGRFAVLLGLEGGHSIVNSLAVLRCLYRLGVRYMTLTWSNSNDWAESSGDLRAPCSALAAGLSSFGREVVHEMNRLGMIVDVSHVSDRTLEDVLETSRAPVLATHSCARALCNSPRNLTDVQLRAIADRGGAVMVNFYAAFVDESLRQAWIAAKPQRDAGHAALAAKYGGGASVPFYLSNRIDQQSAAQLPRPAFESLMAHFQRIIEVAGIDHVGIGTDFDGISAMPAGIDSAADLPRITEWLVDNGYSDEEIRKVLGGNILRVFGEVEGLAEKPPAS
jgi:membrane dipeptidase